MRARLRNLWARLRHRPKREAKYSPQSQLVVLSLTTVFGAGYAMLCTAWFVDDDEVGKIPVAATVLLIVILLAGVILGSDWFMDFVPDELIPNVDGIARKARYGVLYVVLVLCVFLLGLITLPTGGPNASPFTVILLAMALLSPFVTNGLRPTLGIASLAVLCYVGFWQFHDNAQSEIEPPIPPSLEAITAFVSVGISLIAETVREFLSRNKKGGGGATAAGAVGGAGGPGGTGAVSVDDVIHNYGAESASTGESQSPSAST